MPPNPGYDIVKDFAPIGLIASIPIMVQANPAAPVNSLTDIVTMAKKEPGKLTVGTPPPPTLNYFGAELFKSLTGADVTIVTYKGTGPLTNDLVGGHVMLAFNTVPPAIGNIQAGKIKAIAVCAPRGSQLYPMCRPQPRQACPGWTLCSITDCSRRPARRQDCPTPEQGATPDRQFRRCENAADLGWRWADAQHAGGVRRQHRARGRQVARIGQQAWPQDRIAARVAGVLRPLGPRRLLALGTSLLQCTNSVAIEGTAGMPRTRRVRRSDLNDPSATLAVHCGNGFDAWFEPYQSTRLTDTMRPLSLGADMRRRKFISLLGGAAAWPLAAHAQQTTVALLGLLTSSGQDDRWLSALRQGLKELGYIEGRNVAIKHRSADGHFDRLPALAAELVADPWPSSLRSRLRLHWQQKPLRQLFRSFS